MSRGLTHGGSWSIELGQGRDQELANDPGWTGWDNWLAKHNAAEKADADRRASLLPLSSIAVICPPRQ